MLKIAIIEDEKLTAMDLADTLKKLDSEIEIVAILTSVEQAKKFFENEGELDLLFSDIQLPDGLSFDIFKSIKISVPIIFCTAFDQYALEAFKANGIDYLLKPFNKASVAKAIEKYQTLKSNFSTSSENIDIDKLIQVLAHKKSGQATSLLVHQGDKIIPVDLQNVALFYLEDEYVFAFTFDLKKYIVVQSLEELENMCGIPFFRANRQYLINRKAVKDTSRYFNRKLLVNFSISYSQQVIVGKLKTTQFLEWLTTN